MIESREIPAHQQTTETLPRLLVVDDQPVNIQALYEIFHRDHEIFMATSGKQALEMCRNNPPDLILLDVVMPELGGLEVCWLLKQNCETRDIPIIFVTAMNSSDDETAGFAAGAVDFITKPVNPVVVRARVHTHLTLKYQADLLRSFVQNLTSQIMINEQTAIELKEALNLSERANSLMEGREIRIRQIKEEINKLSRDLGRGDIYANADSDEIYGGLISAEDSWKNALSLAEDAEIARREALESNEQLSLIKMAVNCSSDAIAISTTTGDFYYINNTFSSLLGYQVDRLAELPIDLLFDNEKVPDFVFQSITTGMTWQGRVGMYKNDNIVLPVSLRTSPFKDDRDNILGIIWSITDISSQLESEEKINLYTHKIESDLEDKKEMLKKATFLQKSLIQQTIPLLENLNIHALFMPCENLGGDFFRILKGISEEKLVIIIGDCTDHGIKASMDASLLTSLISPNLNILYQDNRTDLFLSNISKEYMKMSDEDQFPTMLAMVIDINSGDVYYSNANSELPLIQKGESIEKLEKAAGMHIGYFNDPEYERKHFILQPGDRLQFFSDAITELRKADNKLLGYSGLKEILFQCKGHGLSIFTSLIDLLKKESGQFPLNDDTTLIQIDYLSPKKEQYEFQTMELWSEIHKKIKKTLDELDYTFDEIEKIGIGIDELCINAFLHGNKSDCSKTVIIHALMDCRKVVFTVEDEGSGFDPESIPDPTKNLEELNQNDVEEEFTHGRGIWITRNFFDSVEYNDKGNIVKITKQKNERQLFPWSH
ncbi:MAG: SpoIIE family protein phosphatase [Spirochaetales bacterium]|nr:SpoIIE family protein phosphatase [Spirochaetales bacterium]